MGWKVETMVSWHSTDLDQVFPVDSIDKAKPPFKWEDLLGKTGKLTFE